MNMKKQDRGTRRPHGSGAVYQIADGTWIAARELPPDRMTGKRRRLTAKGKTKAKAMNRLKAKVKEYESTGRLASHGTPFLRDWLARWLKEIATVGVRPKTARSLEVQMERICAQIGGVRLGRLQPSDMRACIAGLEESLAPLTVRVTWSTFVRCMRDAVREGLIRDNPCEMVDAPNGKRQQFQILTPAQASRLCAMEEDLMWKLDWMLGYQTGMRTGERRGITFDELVTVDGVPCIHVMRQLQRVQDDDPKWPKNLSFTPISKSDHEWLTPPKTDAGDRLVPIPAETLSLLEQWRALRRQLGYGEGPLDLLFVDHKHGGRAVTGARERYMFETALKRADLPHVRIHSMRHTLITALSSQQVPAAVRLAYVGHEDEKVDAQYQHMSVQSLALAASAASKSIGLAPVA